MGPKETVLAAKYFTVSDTGLLSDDLKKRCNNSIEQMYDQVSSDYQNELGVGLAGELKDWVRMIKNGLHPDMVSQWNKEKLTYYEFKTP